MLRIPFLLCNLVFLLTLFIQDAGATPETISTLEDQQAVAVTIYNRNLALIRDQRTITLPSGTHRLAFKDVSGKIQPETALLKADLHVLEQNFEYDLLTPNSLLQKYVGRNLSVVKSHPTTGEEQQLPAKVLSANNGVVLQIADHIETGVPGRLIFPDIPEDLRERPTLTMIVENKTKAQQPLELSYLTSGLSWQADYVAELHADDTALDLNGWVTLSNESGATYRDARLQLVAGDVHRVNTTMRRQLEKNEMIMSTAAAQDSMAEESMFEYHLYTLGRQTTIGDNQRKQVALLHAAAVQCDKEYLLEGRTQLYHSRAGVTPVKMKVGVFIELKNDKAKGLGKPLPAGTVRVYTKDSHGSLQFIGEDRIDHTPEKETIRLKLGEAFDITAEKKQTDFKKLSGFTRYNYAYESAYALTLKNAKTTMVTVKVFEPIPGDWEIITESSQHKKEAAHAASWEIDIPPKSSTTLSYRVQVKY